MRYKKMNSFVRDVIMWNCFGIEERDVGSEERGG